MYASDRLNNVNIFRTFSLQTYLRDHKIISAYKMTMKIKMTAHGIFKNQSKVLLKQEEKRKQILDAAINLMNEKGAAKVSLKEVADSIDLSRNGVYHYFKSQQELIYACHKRALLNLSANLLQALQADGDELDKITYFIDQSLCEAAKEQAVMSNFFLLSSTMQLDLGSIRKDNVTKLTALLQKGTNNQIFRDFDADIAAQTLLGLLDWAQLWHKWAPPCQLNDNPKAIANRLIKDLFFHGLLRKIDGAHQCDINIENIYNRDFNIFDNESINEEKRRRLIGTATFLFNQKGIDATSLDDIANFVGATKGTLYHYFSDKSELINTSYLQSFGQYEELQELAKQHGSSGIDVIMHYLHLNCQAQMSKRPPLILTTGTTTLSETFALKAHALADNLRLFMSHAIQDGSGREIADQFADLSPGFTFWIPSWRIEHPSYDPIYLANKMCHIASQGILNK